MAEIRFRATLTRAGETNTYSAEATFRIKPVKPTSKFISDKLLEMLRSVYPEKEGDKVTFSKVEPKVFGKKSKPGN